MVSKRGQAAGAAVLLAIIVGLIIAFIVLLPPEDRAALLDEETTDDGEAIITGKEILLRESPGRISYVAEKEIEKVIPSTRIFTKVGSDILTEVEYLTVKNTLFSSEEKEVHFGIEDLERTENVLLDFNIESYRGRLMILLNGKEIFNRITPKIRPIKLSKSLLNEENTLTFKVSSPGIAFWKTHMYELKNVKVVADIIDISARESKQYFYISPDEAKNIEEANLRFALSCFQEKISKLEVNLNDYTIFSGVPENCADLFKYEIPPEIISKGNNWLSFKIEDGEYEIYQIAIEIELKEAAYPLYDFEIDEKYFDEDEELKDDYDVILTLEFADDERKEAEVYINGHKISFDTHKIEFSRKLNNQVEPGINSLKIVPQNSFDVRELRVDLRSD